MVLVRHGETDWSRARRHTGRTDVHLSDLGRHQGDLLSERLGARRFAKVLTSPLSRAVETCELAGLAQGAQRLDDLREWDYGAYEGLTTDEVRAQRPQWSLWDGGVPEGETLADVAARADRVLTRLRRAGDAPAGDAPTGDAPTGDAPAGDAPATDVAVFGHGHQLRVLAARWIGLDPVVGRHLALYAGSISTLGWEHETPVLVTWNDVAHLSALRSEPRPRAGG